MNKTIKRILIGAGGLFLLLVAVLAVHIYIVTRPQRITPNLREMARIDIHQPMTKEDAQRITAWLYQKNGVDRVLVNAATRKVIFTYFPYRTSAQQIVRDFKASFPYNADQILPTREQMGKSCPVL